MNFKEKYTKTPDTLKLKFLDAIIAQNNALQEEFMAFARSENNEAGSPLYEHFLGLVQSVQTGYRKQFEGVDTENPDWENYRAPHSGYIKEWEAYQYASEQEFETIFDKFRSDATDRIIRQKADELTAMLIGLYEATQDAEIIDEVDSFDDVNEYLLSEHTDTMNALIEKLRLSAVSGHVILASFEMFFRYCDSEYPGNPHFANHFGQLLIVLAEKSGHAGRLLAIIDSSEVERQALPELVLLLNKNVGNNAEWLQSARQFYRNNEAVGRQLLEFYFETDKGAFIETARELFPANGFLWAKFLQQYVSPQLDEDLFVRVFRQLAIQEKKIGYYNKIREYLTQAECNNLLKELEWDKAFVVEILEVEKRYGDIKTLVEQNPDDWHYTEMITPILTVYPGFCFQHIKNKAIETLQNNRSRSVYERIASWLQLTQNIPGFETEKRELVHKLYNRKPNLPALKDEMRKAGLVE